MNKSCITNNFSTQTSTNSPGLVMQSSSSVSGILCTKYPYFYKAFLSKKTVKEIEEIDRQDDLDYYYKLEWEHDKKLFRNLNDWRYVIETFPAAKSHIKQILQKEIDLAQQDIDESNRIEPIMRDLVYRKVDKKDEDFWNGVIDKLFLEPLRTKQEKIIKTNRMYLSMLSGKSSTTNPLSVTPEEIARAKDFPITTLIEFKHNTAICPFHSEKTPSLHHYQKTNTCHCFGACQKSFDSIEAYRKLNNCSFVEAVRKLQ